MRKLCIDYIKKLSETLVYPKIYIHRCHIQVTQKISSLYLLRLIRPYFLFFQYCIRIIFRYNPTLFLHRYCNSPITHKMYKVGIQYSLDCDLFLSSFYISLKVLFLIYAYKLCIHLTCFYYMNNIQLKNDSYECLLKVRMGVT